MKTLKLLFISLFAFSYAANAYTGDDLLLKKGGSNGGGKLMIGVSVGAGIPVMAFGKSDTLAHSDTTHTNGWAKTGFHFNLNAAYKFTDNIGAMVMIGGNMNGFNSSAYTTQHVPALPSGFTDTYTGTSYYVGSYLVGPLVVLPVGDKFAIHIRALFGLMTMKYSQLTDTYSNPGGSGNSVYTISGASSFGYNIGAGVKIGMTDKLGFVANVDYLGGNPTYTTIKDSYVAGNTIMYPKTEAGS
jgi:hypothetical protein